MVIQPKTINLLTIDVEDWFHTTALDQYLGISQWDNLESRVEANVRKLMEMLEAHQTRATFFILSWVAERFPRLVQDLTAHGHEIGSHGYRHRLVYDLSPSLFKDYLDRSKKILEDLSGKSILGYRATSFSIIKNTLWALDLIKGAGFIYDSSIFPIRHDIYGIDGYPRIPFAHTNGLIEIPPSTVNFLGRNFPVAGGGYFRLYPYWLTKKAIQGINRAGYPAVVYLHPWELDPHCPRIRHIDWRTRFRQYINLKNTRTRLDRLLKDFSFSPIRDQLDNIISIVK
jgi:polysaccharide deacetylase family protein (PEP-CTERM system associated)